ncbi:Alkaline phosphatase synthesis sensor protein PhoR [compost metagenome]
MKDYKFDKRVNRSLFNLRSYLYFFLLVSALVSCSFLVFWNNIDINFRDVRENALLTFVNVLVLSLLCSVIDGFRRKYTVERPVKRILNATHRLTKGEFKARIEPFHNLGRMNEFDVIIADFNRMAEELSGIETLRSDFIANVSHELKTPLAVIQNYATLLQNPALPKEKHTEYARTITQASRRLSELITNILKLNKLENQQIFPEAREYPLGEQLRECLLGFEDAWDKKGVTLVTHIDDTDIKADAELLALVWNNLISNAIKFTDPGGQITVSLQKSNGGATVQIADTGCGMSPEVGRHVFEKFYQGDKAHATEGNGLGLALVKRVIDIVGADIKVESIYGQGSVFTVTLF